MKKAVFIERDGVLNEVQAGPKNQIAPLTLEEFKVRKEAEPALRKLKKAGFVLIVTSNQPGLSRGYQSRRELDRMHGTSGFGDCKSMGELTAMHISLMLDIKPA